MVRCGIRNQKKPWKCFSFVLQERHSIHGRAVAWFLVLCAVWKRISVKISRKQSYENVRVQRLINAHSILLSCRPFCCCIRSLFCCWSSLLPFFSSSFLVGSCLSVSHGRFHSWSLFLFFFPSQTDFNHGWFTLWNAWSSLSHPDDLGLVVGCDRFWPHRQPLLQQGRMRCRLFLYLDLDRIFSLSPRVPVVWFLHW